MTMNRKTIKTTEKIGKEIIEVELTYNKASKKAMSEFVNSVVELYNENRIEQHEKGVVA